MSEKAIAIITARGGSKRIPKKNIKEFCGKPIIAYSIKAALDSGIFDEVMVSTDSEEIAEIARRYGAEVPFMRSAKTSDDFATTADVLLEVLERYQEMGRTFDVMSCIYPTAPFVTPEKLRNALNKLQTSDAKMVMPVVQFSYPPQRGYICKDQWIEMRWPENYKKRSQDLEKIYHDAGQFYLYKVADFFKYRGVVMEKISSIIVDELEVQDIDNIIDWKMAELKYQLLWEENRG